MRRIRMPAPAHADHLDLGSFSYGGEVQATSLNDLAPMHLSWRGDPEELFTDWTVVVRELGGEIVTEPTVTSQVSITFIGTLSVLGREGANTFYNYSKAPAFRSRKIRQAT